MTTFRKFHIDIIILSNLESMLQLCQLSQNVLYSTFSSDVDANPGSQMVLNRHGSFILIWNGVSIFSLIDIFKEYRAVIQ